MQRPADIPIPRERPRLWIALIVLATTASYGRFLLDPDTPAWTYDDVVAVVDNPHVERLWPPWSALDAPPGSGASGRPLVALSLALDFALHGRSIRGYLLTNLALHLLAALALFALARRLARDARPPGARPSPTVAAGLVALVWTAHPLHTMALCNVVYRNEVLAGLFCLLTLLFAARAMAGGARAKSAAGLAVLACLSGAASKEVLVSAPIAVLLLDRAFHSPSLRTALTRRRWMYAGLALTWPLLALLVAIGDRGESVGMDLEGISPLDYLRTQAGVLVHYLRLAFWPDPLVLDYDGWPIVRSWSGALLPGLVVLALVSASIAGLARRRLAGWCGTVALLVLAPSSSIVPLSGAIAGEHRMYLPLAALVAITGMGLARVGLRGRTLAALAGAATLALGLATIARSGDYFSSERSIWRDTVEKRPDNPRAWSSLAVELREAGEVDEAEAALEEALRIHPRYYKALLNLGNLRLEERGDLEGAHALYERALATRPDLSDTHYSAGSTSIALGRLRPGIASLREALRLGLDPVRGAAARRELAWVLATAPEVELRDGREALALARELEAGSTGGQPRTLDAIAAALAENGRFDEAAAQLERALALARSRGNEDYARRLALRLESYRARRPWRGAP